MTTVAFTINSKPASVDADADTPLLWIIREHLKLTGTSTLPMSGDGKRGVAEWPKLPRPSSTLPETSFAARKAEGSSACSKRR